ncbi:hypothetical protein [Streptacidiphilus sp. EB103A]|uniref:hypothetical protein n=1 Tax=Streptacidiphilus sp. EB103A TaxID=3156275 RepID=UPI003511531F
MSSRENLRPQSPELAAAWESLEAGDVPAALRKIRHSADTLPLGEVALVVERAADSAGFDDLKQASAKLAGEPEDGLSLFEFGYACIERGLSYLAVPAMREVLRQSPDAVAPLRELVAAYETETRHREAADLLLAHEAALVDWPDRYLLVFNALMAGDLELANRQYALLTAPDDARWLPARDRLARMLRRAAAAAPATALDRDDLRGWQFVIGGTVLGTLSPYGFADGMRGRYAWIQDSYGECLRGLRRLRTVLAAAGLQPRSISLLPDRDSRILGLAAAEVFGLPAEPFAAGRQDTVVIAYNLDGVIGEETRAEGGEALRALLLGRAPGQVLHEHASCWTDAPPLTADSVALLYQSLVPPWGARLRQNGDGQVEQTVVDDRSVEELAAEIVRAEPPFDADAGTGDGEADDGANDDGAPADTDERLSAFVSAVRADWLQGGRPPMPSTGPVSSSRFL